MAKSQRGFASPKMRVANFVSGMLVLMAMCMVASCESAFLDNNKTKTIQEAPRTSEISKRIGQLKEAGLLDSILETREGRSVADETSEVDYEQIAYFINNTDEALAEIAQSENGDVQINLINAMFNGGTVSEIAAIMAEISEDMATGFLNDVERNLGEYIDIADIENGAGRSVLPVNSAKRDIRLRFADETVANARGAYESNLDRDTIAWYGGFCVATTAGVWAAKSIWPWISIPGAVAAVAGAVSMSVQLVKWYNCTEFKGWINSLIGKNTSAIDSILRNSKVLDKLITITALTAGTIVLCAVSPVGRTVIALFKSAWNTMVAKIISVTNVNWTVWGIELSPITW
jgi:hypothetical protein